MLLDAEVGNIIFLVISYQIQPGSTHHAEGLVLPKMYKKRNWLVVLDTPENLESENIKLKIGYRPSLYQLFSKRDFYFIKCRENWRNNFFLVVKIRTN
jgi:hypothetical protein